MSNSAMVTYTKLSPNHSGTRTHIIDTITIHHMAGNCSVQTCGDIFAPKSRQASSNYGVSGKKVGLYVDEKNRSWCSSNRTNDQRAITIEVANDAAGVRNKTWTVSDETMNTLIKLVADICKRNGIAKLIWSDKRNDRINHVNGCNMTLHEDFANTLCPGPYLKSKMPYIAEEVNKLLDGVTPDPVNQPIGVKYSGTFPTLPSRGYFQKGDKGVNVTRMQQFLIWYDGTFLPRYGADGSFGSETLAAVRAFQTREKLVVDGLFGKKSLAAAKAVRK